MGLLGDGGQAMSNEMPKDIAAELRVRAAIEQVKGSLFERAANEIEWLREALRIEQEELAACCIDRRETQRERDEARREICLLRASSTNATEKVSAEMEEYARSRGWENLFGEDR